MSTFKTPPPFKGKIKPKTKTRSQTMDDFKHVLHIIDMNENSELERALQTAMITSVRHILRITDEVLDNLEFKKGDKTLPVPTYQTASLRLFIEYCKYRARAKDPVLDFQIITKEDIDLFTLLAPVTVTAPVPGSSTYPPSSSDPALKDFNRGIKRDPNHFQTFSNERHWSDYQDHTIATANSQNIANVFNPSFVPINGEAADLFLAQQKYVFQVFVTNLKTDKGKELVKQYKDTFDAQSVWAALVAHMKTSTTAKINTRKLFQYITNVRIDDGSWRGTTSAFLTHWTEKIRMYDEK